MSAEKFVEIQNQMRLNQSELKDYLADLDSWSADIKEKDEKLKQSAVKDGGVVKDLPPVRNSLDKKIRKKKKTKKDGSTKDKPKKISGYDFREWDKFDADKACEEIDKHDAADGVKHSSSEYETDEEWEVLRKKQQGIQMKDQGNQYFKEGRYEESIECYTRGITCDPTNALLPANRAMALIKQEKYGAAELDCSLSISLDATYLKAYQRRGTSRIALKKLKEAKEDFQFVLKKEPQNKLAIEQLEKIEKLMNPPKFSTSTEGDAGIVKPIYKPPHLRSKKPGRRIVIEEVGDDDEEENATKSSQKSSAHNPAAQKLAARDNQSFEKFVKTEPVIHPVISEIPDTPKDNTNPTSETQKAAVTSRDTNSTSENHSDKDSHKQSASTQSPGLDNQDLKIDLSSNDNSSKHKDVTPKSSPRQAMSPSDGSSPRILATPCTAFQFQADWKVLKNTTQQFFQYFKEIDPASYPKLFGQFLDADILMKVLRILVDCYIPEGLDIRPVLHHLTKVKRFQMTVMFLMDKDKQIIKMLFDHLESQKTTLKEDLNKLRKEYGL